MSLRGVPLGGAELLPADPVQGGGEPGRGCWEREREGEGSKNWGRTGGVGLEGCLETWVEEK